MEKQCVRDNPSETLLLILYLICVICASYLCYKRLAYYGSPNYFVSLLTISFTNIECNFTYISEIAEKGVVFFAFDAG